MLCLTFFNIGLLHFLVTVCYQEISDCKMLGSPIEVTRAFFSIIKSCEPYRQIRRAHLSVVYITKFILFL